MRDKDGGFEPREICQRCERPARVCVCAALREISTRTRVVVLQHPREAKVRIGTAKLLRLALPASTVEEALHFPPSSEARMTVERAGARAALLFPGRDIPPLQAARNEAPATLVILDGTWSTAKTLLRDNPWLARVPRYRLPEGDPSEYRIRREPHESFVSTIEATARALEVLEPEGFEPDALLAPFRLMVSQQESFAREVGCARHFGKGRSKKPLNEKLPAALFGDGARIVCAEGEANAWPRVKEGPQNPPDEIVHVVGKRLDDSALFDEIGAPTDPLSPSTPEHIQLDRTLVEGSQPRSEFRARVQAMMDRADVLVAWGTYAMSTLAREGVTLPPVRIDLRRALTLATNTRSGSIAKILAREGLEEGPPVGRGRAGKRLAALLVLTRHIRHLG